MSRRLPRLIVTACAVLSLAAPTAAAAAAPTPEQRRAEILQAYGGAYEGPINAYVRRIGERMAAAAGQGGRCTFSVIDTPVVNAFASPPGCDIYVTRGLLGLIRSEDELAAVLGHEVGHVAADHAGRRQTRSTITGIGAILLGAVAGSAEVAELAGKAGQLGVLSYSRGQEFEADNLSARYLASAGYSPFGLADMLSALQASDQLEALDRGGETRVQPVWSRTHPLTGERVARAQAAARATPPPAPDAPPGQADGYLDAVNGLMFGENPQQGVVLGRRFVHPDLGFGFAAPSGFVLANSPSAVTIQGPDGLTAQFAGPVGERGDLVDEAYAVLRQVIGQAPARTAQLQRTRIDGYEAVILPAEAQSSRGWVDVTVAVFAVDRANFHFVALAPSGRAYVFDPLIASFHRLTPAERGEARPRRIRVVVVKPGDTIASLAAVMAVSDHPRDCFEAINGLQPGDALRPGDRVKIVIAAP
jgi:predicted Zn-dependent protease